MSSICSISSINNSFKKFTQNTSNGEHVIRMLKHDNRLIALVHHLVLPLVGTSGEIVPETLQVNSAGGGCNLIN